MSIIDQQLQEILTEVAEKNKQESESADFTAGEVISMLAREGYNITSQKLRQYEAKGLIYPTIKETKHRLYNSFVIQQIRRILLLILLDFSIKEIKKYFDLTSQIFIDDTKNFMGLKQEKEKREPTDPQYGVHNRLERLRLRLLEAIDFTNEIKHRYNLKVRILTDGKDCLNFSEKDFHILEVFLGGVEREIKS